jgi:polyhydroxyalkanoate synthesis regulator protein
VKRYARCRLYDAVNRRYVTVEQLRDWKAKGIAFSVKDTETGADISRVLLA